MERGSLSFLGGPPPSAQVPHPEQAIKGSKETAHPWPGSCLFIMQTHASESVEVQLGEDQQAINQEPEEEDKVHHVWLLDELHQRVVLWAVGLLRPGFARAVGLPAGGETHQGSHKWVPSPVEPPPSLYSSLTAQLESCGLPSEVQTQAEGWVPGCFELLTALSSSSQRQEGGAVSPILQTGVESGWEGGLLKAIQ